MKNNEAKKLFVAYRHNPLYDAIVPQILAGLGIEGQSLVPEGVISSPQLRQEILEAFSASGADVLVLDDTLFPKGQRSVSITDLLAEQVENWLRTQQPEMIFRWLVQQMVGQKKIAHVIIGTHNIEAEDLLRGKYIDTNRGWFEAERQKFLKEFPLYCDGGGDMIGWLKQEAKRHRIKWFKERVKDLFPDVHSFEIYHRDALWHLSQPDTLLVANRYMFDCWCYHNDRFDKGLAAEFHESNYGDLYCWPHQASVLLLPFEDTVRLLLSKGNIDFSFDVSALRERLRLAIAQ
jgi:hypothetical protein